MTPRANVIANQFPATPKCWSALTWQQLTAVWQAKLRYGGNPDAARAAALLAILGCSACRDSASFTLSGERQYILKGEDGRLWATTPRQLAYFAKKALPWIDYPYGDPGEPVVKDEKGKVIKEPRNPVIGYVNPNWKDAMQLPQETVTVNVSSSKEEEVVFSLPQLAMSNLTWEQYRSIQPLVPQLFNKAVSEAQAVQMQAQFVSHCLVPESVRTEPDNDRFQPKHTFKYDSGRAEMTVPLWEKKIAKGSVIFHICFQVYQTSVQYYSTVYPLLFNGDGKEDPMRDALTGEIGTINAVMRYAKYRKQREVYESYMPYVLDILNTMAKESKEIEKMNAKIKKK